MNLPFFNKKTNQSLKLPESLLLKKLKSVVHTNNFLIFENITIYHHNKNFFIPLVIADESRGIFLFEYKDWSYDDLKNSKIEKASKQDSTKNNLAFEKSHDIIKRKFNELKHHDVPIFNYLLMENLNFEQYKHLDSSFKELLPQESVMFNDNSEKIIFEKIIDNSRTTYNLPSTSNIMTTLLIQYAILDDKKNIYLASDEQIKFIESPLIKYSVLKAPFGSGRTSSILLKAILEKLKNPNLKILIIKPSNLACDILKKKLLDTIENAIIEVDPTSIEITTPNNFIYNPPRSIDLIICDDSWNYSDSFIKDIKKIENKKYLIMVENSSTTKETNTFTKSFKNKNREIIFHQINQHAKALQLISSLLSSYEPKDILVVGSNSSRLKLKEDLEFFIDKKSVLLDNSKGLIYQNLDNLLLATYQDVHIKNAIFVIMMDIDTTDIKKLEYTYNLCSKRVHILYDNESENLKLLRNDFESNKNS